MKIYKVEHDLRRYQSLSASDATIAGIYWKLHRTSLRLNWEIPEVYVETPSKIKGNFFRFLGIVLDEKAKTLLEAQLSDNELLPLWCANDTLYLLNIVNSVDCLDTKKTVRNHLAFVKKRLPPCNCIFNTPQDPSLFLTLSINDNGLREILLQQGLPGLEFEEVWSDKKIRPFIYASISTEVERSVVSLQNIN